MTAAEKATAPITVDGAAFAAALDQVVRAASVDAKEGVKHCVLVEARSTSLRLVATDAARLGVSEIEATGRNRASFSALVAAPPLAHLGDAVAHGEVQIWVERGSLVVAVAGQSQSLPIAAGQFPDYERFLAADPEASTLVVDKAALLAAIEDLPEDEPLSFRFTREGLRLGDIVPITVPAAYEGDELAFALNPIFAHDAVQPAPGTELAIEASSPIAPVVFRPVGGESFTAIVMPVRKGSPGRSSPGRSSPR